MIILFWFTPEAKETNRDTFEFIKALQADGYPDIVMEETATEDPYSCYVVLQKYWGRDDLVIIDQDMMFSRADLDRIIMCREKMCTAPYVAAQYSQYVKGEEALTIGYYDKNGIVHLYTRNLMIPRMVEFCGTGLTKIAKELQCAPLEPFTTSTPKHLGDGIDKSIFKNLNKDKQQKQLVHVHPEVTHNHRIKLWYYGPLAELTSLGASLLNKGEKMKEMKK